MNMCSIFFTLKNNEFYSEFIEMKDVGINQCIK
jgi:hypothetical protein